MINSIKSQDSEAYNAIKSELARQRNGIELIASENFVSKAVLEAAGTVLTNKYSEGYPGKRYYGGNNFIDMTEQLAIDRAKKLFGAEHVNVQPHSGSSANMEAYFALLNLGDKVLGMDLSCGGHLTHGSKVNFSGKFYNFSSYGVNKETMRIDMDEVRKTALKEKPKLILAGFSAYPREIDFKEFYEIANEVNAYFMADIAHIAGLVAVKRHNSPVPYADVVTTTTHKTLRGPRGAIIMSKKEDRLKSLYFPDSKKNLAQRIDSAVFPGMQGGPLDHVIAAKAVAFGEALKPEFKSYIDQVLKNAKALAKSLMDNSISLVTEGTDNHLMLIDLTDKGLGGKEVELALENAGIYANKNVIPFDNRSPFDPSGIRLGTPALTTRGMKEKQMHYIGELIARVINNVKNKQIIEKTRHEVNELVKNFPIYTDLEY